MKIALIPPIPDLEMSLLGDMQFALHHLCENETYRNFYREQAAIGEYVILDNGAHENNVGTNIEDLVVTAAHIQAREIVLPDTLFHAMHTVEAARESFKVLAESPLFKSFSPTPRLMIVPQGRDSLDWEWCLDAMLRSAQAHGFFELLVIGLSKDYEKQEGFPLLGLDHLINRFLQPLYEKYKI